MTKYKLLPADKVNDEIYHSKLGIPQGIMTVAGWYNSKRGIPPTFATIIHQEFSDIAVLYDNRNREIGIVHKKWIEPLNPQLEFDF
jgi:hypothetical protein